MEMMLQTAELCKSFKKQKAVNQASLNIVKGKVYGLLGPNGAGKSTILKMVTGILKPDEGEIYFNGKPWSRDMLSEIGAHPRLSAYQVPLQDARGLRPGPRCRVLPRTRN